VRRALGYLAFLLVLVPALARCGDLSLNVQLASVLDANVATSFVVPCSVKSQCADAGDDSICNVDAGACVQCLSNADCSGSTPHCIDGACGSCISSADCPSGKACNSHIPRCETICSTKEECNDGGGGGPCASEYGYCVECIVNADCPTKALPLCNPPPYGLCVGCLSNADCDGAVCGPAQHCE
jgi:hypothetical protein